MVRPRASNTDSGTEDDSGVTRLDSARQRLPRRTVAPLRPRPPRKRSQRLLEFTPLAIAVVSLLISLFSIVQSNRAPEVHLTLPSIVRIAQGSNDAWLYLQPRFVNTGRNDRVAVISNMQLHLERPGVDPVEFTWDEQGTWTYNVERNDLNWLYLADPAPLAVSRTSPQLPINLFVSPAGWEWQPGLYRVVVEAEQSTTDDLLRSSIQITVSEPDVEAIRARPNEGVVQITTNPN